MIVVKSIDQSAQKRVRNSIKAYLEGLQNFGWIAGIIAKENKTLEARQMLVELKNYPGVAVRYEELLTWLDLQLS